MKKLVWVGTLCIVAGAAAGWAPHGAASRDPRLTMSAHLRDANSSPDEAAATTVTLDPDAVKDMGLRVTVLRAVWHAPQLRTNAVVLSPQSLATLSANYSTDTKDLAVYRANLAVAENEYQRQKVLYRENQNTSLKAFQAAEGTLQSTQAQVVAAQHQLQLDAFAAQQQWGPVVGKWLVDPSPALQKILGQQEWFVEVTLGASDPPSAPRKVQFSAPSGTAVFGHLISSLPQTNPVIQGLNFLYQIPASPGFAPGLNLVAEMPAGSARRGVLIPTSAVVWSQGEAWAYKEIASGRFERLTVSTREPVTNGWFVTTGFASGDRVVTSAAEEVFSVEAQSAGGNQGKEGDDD